MSRVIKFRAWCNIPCLALVESTWIGGMMMCVVSSLNIKTGKARVLFTRENGEKSYETIDISKSELMQYTGQKDQNGVEVYEGDILDFDYKERCLVVFRRSAFVGTDIERMNHAFCDLPTPCKVIGNIHQNPDLLK